MIALDSGWLPLVTKANNLSDLFGISGCLVLQYLVHIPSVTKLLLVLIKYTERVIQLFIPL